MLNIAVKNQFLDIAENIVVAGTIDYLTAEVSFSTDWDGAIKYAHFDNGEHSYIVPINDGEITEDAHLNLSAGKWRLYIHGDKTEGGILTQRITTNVQTLKVIKTGILNGEPLPVSPPSIGEQILAIAQNAEEIAQSVRDDADAGIFDGEQGIPGDTPQRGVDYWTAEDQSAIVADVLAALPYGDEVSY